VTYCEILGLPYLQNGKDRNFVFGTHIEHNMHLSLHDKLEGCIDDERQFKTAKHSQGLLVAFYTADLRVG